MSGLVINLGLGIGWGTSGLGGASLNLEFLSEVIDPRITASGGSNGTRINSAGVLVAASAPRFDYDPVTLAPKGLLVEEARTNLFLNSNIDGTGLATQNVTTAATAYTISFYGTGTITLTGTSTAGPIIGTGAYPARTTLTFTPTAGALTCTVTGTVQYAQIEAGTFATSYIPTAAAAVTRTVDVLTMTGANFSSWYNQTAGTFLLSASLNPGPSTGARWLIQADDGTINNRHYMTSTPTAALSQVVSAGVTHTTLTLSLPTTGVPFKIASAYAVDDYRASKDGGAIAVSTSGALPVGVNRMLLCRYASSSINGHLRSLAYYPTALPDAQLRALTA